jgi:hypothetical protein
MTIIIKTKNNFERTIELIDTHHPDVAIEAFLVKMFSRCLSWSRKE